MSEENAKIDQLQTQDTKEKEKNTEQEVDQQEGIENCAKDEEQPLNDQVEDTKNDKADGNQILEDNDPASTESNQFLSNTDNPKLQMKLAWSLGYPSTWHVVRVYPHPATPKILDSYMDRIYAGDPKHNVDTYFNHHAAMTAALRFEEGVSTGYDNKGGQMLPRKAKFKAKERVEVLYEDDGQWYDATVVKVKMFVDDIRYTIHYEAEDATQTNVAEELLRAWTPKKSDKRNTNKAKKRASSANSKAAKKKKSEKIQSKITAFASTVGKSSSLDKEVPLEPDHDAALELAKKLGFPDGWTARSRSNSRYDIRTPNNKHKFKTKRAAFEFLQKNLSELENSDHIEVDHLNEGDEINKLSAREKEEAGDPPWRRVDHHYLGRSVRYPTDQDQSKYQIGEVTGWLSETDVDSEGNPAFLSERSGKPAKLFHVSFSDKGELLFVDLEEFELEEVLMGTEEDEIQKGGNNSDEDELPLSKMVKMEKWKDGGGND